MEMVRVLRVLEYIGDREWVEDTLKNSSVPIDGSRIFLNKGYNNYIKSAIVDKFPEILSGGVE